MDNGPVPPNGERRGFLKKSAAVILGALSGIVPGAAGLAVFLDPLRKTSQQAQTTFVATLQALPEDGSPRKFRVVADHSDVWNRTPQVPIGAVYLRKAGGAVQAFNVVCPHAGCFVDFRADQKGYLCPCHNSTFGLDGKITDPKSPSPRGLDELEVEIRNNQEIWVKFQNFLAGSHEKIPIS